MSELFMECVEEELEPWQKQVSEVHLIDDDDDDDEPIFVGVLCMLKDLLKYNILMFITAYTLTLQMCNNIIHIIVFNNCLR